MLLEMLTSFCAGGPVSGSSRRAEGEREAAVAATSMGEGAGGGGGGGGGGFGGGTWDDDAPGWAAAATGVELRSAEAVVAAAARMRSSSVRFRLSFTRSDRDLAARKWLKEEVDRVITRMQVGGFVNPGHFKIIYCTLQHRIKIRLYVVYLKRHLQTTKCCQNLLKNERTLCQCGEEDLPSVLVGQGRRGDRRVQRRGRRGRPAAARGRRGRRAVGIRRRQGSLRGRGEGGGGLELHEGDVEDLGDEALLLLQRPRNLHVLPPQLLCNYYRHYFQILSMGVVKSEIHIPE